MELDLIDHERCQRRSDVSQDRDDYPRWDGQHRSAESLKHVSFTYLVLGVIDSIKQSEQADPRGTITLVNTVGLCVPQVVPVL